MNKKDEKREAAKVLYMEGIKQEDICDILSVAPNTITRWKQQDNWVERKIQRNMHDQTIEDSVRELIAYQLEVLKYKKNLQLALAAEERELIGRGDIDALQKLFTTVKRDILKYETYIKVIKQVLAFAADENIEVAKKLEPITNKFLNEISKTLI
jgi:predicted transcriptional regulator